jgi:hypothetical protein
MSVVTTVDLQWVYDMEPFPDLRFRSDKSPWYGKDHLSRRHAPYMTALCGFVPTAYTETGLISPCRKCADIALLRETFIAQRGLTLPEDYPDDMTYYSTLHPAGLTW